MCIIVRIVVFLLVGNLFSPARLVQMLKIQDNCYFSMQKTSIWFIRLISLD